VAPWQVCFAPPPRKLTRRTNSSERISDGEEIVNTPIKECIDLLIQGVNNERRKGDGADKEVLKKGFSFLVGFPFDIARRCENFLEGD